MSKYLQTDDPRIQRKVNETIETIRDTIHKELAPRSIILKGSFGRDEASIMESEGKLKFLSDCEIIIIPKKHINGRELAKLSSSLTENLGLDIEIVGLEPELIFCLNFHLWNRIPPTIDNFDLKYGSKVIYGSNPIQNIPNFNAEDIPVWEGIRLILNRMAELLYYLDDKNKLLFWTNKLILACQDALLIMDGRYNSSYRTRNEIFKKNSIHNFEPLIGRIPDFLSLTVEATKFKLNPQKAYTNDVIALWREVSKVTDMIFRFIIETDMGIKFNSYLEFQYLFLNHPNITSKYYRGLSSSPYYQNLRSLIKARVLGYDIPVSKVIHNINIPWTHVVYSMIPLIYFDQTQNYSNEMRLCWSEWFGLDYTDDRFSEKDYLAKLVLNAWRNLCY